MGRGGGVRGVGSVGGGVDSGSRSGGGLYPPPADILVQRCNSAMYTTQGK